MNPLRRLLNQGLIAVACLVSLFPLRAALAATVVVGSGSMVDGSGTMIDDARAVSGYTRVVVSAPVEVQLKHTGAEKAVVHADDNIATLIETRVEGGWLHIETTKDVSFRTRNKIFVVVEFKQLDALRVDGSGDVLADDIKAGIFEGVIHGSGNVRIARLEADTVAVSIAGSGNFNARGRADKVGFVIEGSGDVLAEDLLAKSAAVRIAGSGDARVNATETLQARIAGSGDVRYRGSPQVDKKIAGSGEVKPLH
ncbi:MAG TPA: head GIN domain-containing protein [Burkholderiaceae bacterium]|nr:head GIN domain-containing protein [Burkholderiaceae bacterium]